MKITSVECYLGDGALGGFVTIKVNTDEGISGFGEAGLAYGNCSEAAFGQCQDFAKLVIGMVYHPKRQSHLSKQVSLLRPNSILVSSQRTAYVSLLRIRKSG